MQDNIEGKNLNDQRDEQTEFDSEYHRNYILPQTRIDSSDCDLMDTFYLYVSDNTEDN